jgi:hypothetical protein
MLVQQVGLGEQHVLLHRGRRQVRWREMSRCNRCREVLAVACLQILGHQRGRKGQHADCEQEQEIEEQDRVIDAGDAP